MQKVDGNGNQGYNENKNDTEGGKKYDASQTGRYRENRHGSNKSDTKEPRTGKDSWPESKGEFLKRHVSNSKKIVAKPNNILFAYNTAKADTSKTYKDIKYLQSVGVKVVYCDGVMESNKNGNTETHPERFRRLVLSYNTICRRE